MEIRDIKGFEGLYSIREDGAVFSKRKGIRMKEQLGSCGYWYVKLRKNGKRKHCNVHRALAEHFIPNPENKPQVNHIDGDRGNNNMANLEWVTASENVKHGFTHNGREACRTMTGKKGSLHPRAVKINQLDINGNFIECFYGYAEASRETGIIMQNIQKVCKGRRKTAGGFKWSLATVSDLEETK